MRAVREGSVGRPGLTMAPGAPGAPEPAAARFLPIHAVSAFRRRCRLGRKKKRDDIFSGISMQLTKVCDEEGWWPWVGAVQQLHAHMCACK